MREIKFRAWDKERNKMYEVISLYTQHKNKDFGGKFVEIGYSYSDYKTGNIILMQYTGLKDKNGEEIYEGDIVEWENCKFSIEWNNSYGCWGGVPSPLNDVIGILFVTTFRKSKIIGNIYENPELIKEDK